MVQGLFPRECFASAAGMGPAVCAVVTTSSQSSSWWVLSNAALPTTTCMIHPKPSAALCTYGTQECNLFPAA